MSSESERIAILETKTRAIEATVNRVDSNVEEIKISLGKQKGFIAGTMFVIAPIWLLVVTFAKETWQLLTN